MRLLESGAGRITLQQLEEPGAVAERLAATGTPTRALPGATAAVVECARALRARGWSGEVEAFAFRVPGRIEVLGKHTDYGGGRSLLTAVEQGFSMVAVRRPDHAVHLVDLKRNTMARLALDPQLTPERGWSVYAGAVARRIAKNFPEAATGADLVFTSDLPSAAGVSSSSALVVAVFAALAVANDLPGSPRFGQSIRSDEDLAGYLGAVENGRSYGQLLGDLGVGTQGGSQDHTAILCARAGRVVQFAWSPVRRERVVPVPEGFGFVVAASGVLAKKTGAAMARYNRAAEVMRALETIWRQHVGDTGATVGGAVDAGPAAVARLRHLASRGGPAGMSSKLLLARLDHFAAEAGEIVPAAGAALERDDLEGFGRLVDRSQQLAEQLLGNQVEETAALARIARGEGAAAASAFGAGFGGSVWALVRETEAEDFARRWRAAYLGRFPERATGARWVHTSAGPPAIRLA